MKFPVHGYEVNAIEFKKKKSYKRQKESGEQCLIEIRGQVLQCKSIKNTNKTAPLKNRYHE